MRQLIHQNQLNKNLRNKKLYYGLSSSLSHKSIYVSEDFYQLLSTEIVIKHKEKLLQKQFKLFKKETLLKIPGTMNRKHLINVISHD